MLWSLSSPHGLPRLKASGIWRAREPIVDHTGQPPKAESLVEKSRNGSGMIKDDIHRIYLSKFFFIKLNSSAPPIIPAIIALLYMYTYAPLVQSLIAFA